MLRFLFPFRDLSWLRDESTSGVGSFVVADARKWIVDSGSSPENSREKLNLAGRFCLRLKEIGSVRPPASDSFERFWWVSLSRVDDRADEDGLPVSDPEIVDMTDHGSKSCQHRSCTIAPIRN